MNDELAQALTLDLGKSVFITEMVSINVCLWDAEFSLEHVDEVNSLSA